MTTKAKAPVAPEKKPPIQGVELNAASKAEVKAAIQTLTGVNLEERINNVKKAADKTQQLENLKEKYSEIRAWDYNPESEILQLSIKCGRRTFDTTNPTVISEVLDTLQDRFGKRVIEVETELATMAI